MSVISEEREGSSAGRPMSTAEVPSSCKNTYVFGYLKVECDGMEQACHCSRVSAKLDKTLRKVLTIVLG